MRHTSISKILITYVVAGVLLLTLSPTAYLRASTTIKGESIIVDTPVLSLTTASADTTLTATTAAHEAMISIVFGTVSGTYTTCTAQLKTSLDNTNFLTLGSPQSITVTTGTVNVWTILAQAPTTSVTSGAEIG